MTNQNAETFDPKQLVKIRQFFEEGRFMVTETDIHGNERTFDRTEEVPPEVGEEGPER